MSKTMKMLSMLVLLSYLAATPALASPPKIWMGSSNTFISVPYVTNGQVKVHPGFFGGFDIRDLVKDNPAALAMAEKQSKAIKDAHAAYWGMVLPSAFFLGYGLGSRDATLSLFSLGTMIGASVLAGHFVSKAHHYMYEAINIYNGVEQFEEQKMSLRSPFEFRSTGAAASGSVGLSFSF